MPKLLTIGQGKKIKAKNIEGRGGGVKASRVKQHAGSHSNKAICTVTVSSPLIIA